MTFTAEPGPDDPPHDAHARARVEAAREHRGQLGDQLAESEGEVLGEVRTRGVAALAGQQHVEGVGSTGERALAQPDGAHVEPGVGVQPEDPGDPVEDAGLDRHQRATGHDLLGRLEDQADPPGQLVGHLAQRETRAEQRRGVHVVAAGVRDALHGARPRVVAPVVDREGVEVGAERDHRPRTRPDVDHQAVAREQGRHQTDLVEPLGDHRRGPLLGPGQLGVGVQVAAYLDQLVLLRVDTGQHRLEQVGVLDWGSGGHNGQEYRPAVPTGTRWAVTRPGSPATAPR